MTMFQRQIGEQRQFRLGDSNILAGLSLVSNHAYIYTYTSDPGNFPVPETRILKWLADQFDEIYPRVIDFWGITDPPHIEGDRRIVFLVHTGKIYIGSFYTSRSSMPQELNPSPYETGYISINFSGDDYHHYYLQLLVEIMAHEFFHMIHHKLDPGALRWEKEGLAEFQRVFFSPRTLTNSTAAGYLENPRVQLNHLQNGTYIDYGGGLLFFSYIYERFGRDFLRQFAFHPQQGLDALDALLAAHGAGISADDVFTDWVIANFLLDNRRENGRFGYPTLGSPNMTPAQPRSVIYSLPASRDEFTSRYSTDYFELSAAALDESRLLLFRFNPAEPPQDAWLQLVQVLPDRIDVQRFRASQQGEGAIAAALHNNASRTFLAVSPFSPGDRRRTGPVFYSLDLGQQEGDFAGLTPSISQSAGVVNPSSSLTFSGQVNQQATDLGALGRIFRASHASGPALVVYRFVSAQDGELAFWVTQQELDAAGVGCVKASADRRIAASKQANNNVVIAMGPDAENKTFHAIFDGGVSGGVSGISTTYDGPPGAGC